MSGHGVVRTSIALLGSFCFVAIVHGDPLDGLPLESRAMLATAASAFPSHVAPALDPADPSFNPAAAEGYLETNNTGRQYGARLELGELQATITFTLLQFADEEQAKASIEQMRVSGIPRPEETGWNDVGFPTYQRTQGAVDLLDIGSGGLEGAESGGIVAFGQKGPWLFQVEAVTRHPQMIKQVQRALGPGLHKGMVVLATNAQRYRLFGEELVIECTLGTAAPFLLRTGEPLQVPLREDEESSVRFKLQVLDAAKKPLEGVSWRVKLGGGMASHAELEEGGARTRRAEVERRVEGSEPLELTWVFPPGSSAILRSVIDQGEGTDLALSVEAKVAP